MLVETLMEIDTIKYGSASLHYLQEAGCCSWPRFGIFQKLVQSLTRHKHHGNRYTWVIRNEWSRGIILRNLCKCDRMPDGAFAESGKMALFIWCCDKPSAAVTNFTSQLMLSHFLQWITHGWRFKCILVRANRKFTWMCFCFAYIWDDHQADIEAHWRRKWPWKVIVGLWCWMHCGHINHFLGKMADSPDKAKP